MLFKDINNNALKKVFGFSYARVRYHNKNKSGGNFGTNYVIGEYGKPGYENYEIENYEIHGAYDTHGVLYQLGMGKAYQVGYRIDPNSITSFDDLVMKFKNVIEAERKRE